MMRKFTRKHWAVVCVVVVAVLVPSTVLGADISAPRASITTLTTSPLQPTAVDKIEIDVSVTGGAYVFLKPSVTINYASQSIDSGGSTGGGSTTNNDNQYRAKIGPFPNGSLVWYMIGMNDRGKMSYSESQQFTVGQVQSLSTITTTSSSILSSIDPESGQITAVYLSTLPTNIPIQNMTLSILGFSPKGTYTESMPILENQNNSIICVFHPDKLYWSNGTTLFYRLIVTDPLGNIQASQVESYTISSL